MVFKYKILFLVFLFIIFINSTFILGDTKKNDDYLEHPLFIGTVVLGGIASAYWISEYPILLGSVELFSVFNGQYVPRNIAIVTPAVIYNYFLSQGDSRDTVFLKNIAILGIGSLLFSSSKKNNSEEKLNTELILPKNGIGLVMSYKFDIK